MAGMPFSMFLSHQNLQERVPVPTTAAEVQSLSQMMRLMELLG